MSDAKGAQPEQLVETAMKQMKDATAILADWAEEGGFNSVDVDDERARVFGAFEVLATALSECREDLRLWEEQARRCIDIAEDNRIEAFVACGRIAVILGNVLDAQPPSEASERSGT